MPQPPTDRQHSPIDQQLADAYRGAYYLVNGFTLQIGESQPEFDAWLARRRATTYCLLTAHNPQSQRLPAAVNEARHRTLIRLLDPPGP